MTGRLRSVPPETVARTIDLICAPRVMIVERTLAAHGGAASRHRCAWRIVVWPAGRIVVCAWVSAGFAGCLDDCERDIRLPVGYRGSLVKKRPCHLWLH